MSAKPRRTEPHRRYRGASFDTSSATNFRLPDQPLVGRSRCHSPIRARGNKATELRLIAVFRGHGIILLRHGYGGQAGWRRGSKLTDKPDFVFPRLKLAVFVDGCFSRRSLSYGRQVWRGCPKHFTKPKTNAAFWRKKIARNQARDREVNRALRGRVGGCCGLGSMN
jgi:DNA mismatch endonuclease (patch repair protein)